MNNLIFRPDIKSFLKITICFCIMYLVVMLDLGLYYKQVKQEPELSEICNQEDRRKHLSEMCAQKKAAMKQWRKQPQLIVDDEHKVAYCGIAKAASTTMTMLMLSSLSKAQHMPKPVRSEPHDVEQLTKRGLRVTSDIKHLEKYTKFLIVRNPYERLVSAYEDKFTPFYDSFNEFYIKRKKKMLRAINKNPKEQLTFSDLVYCIENKIERAAFNIHLKPYTQICDVCRVNYDYILRVETLNTDINLILPLLNQNLQGYVNATSNVKSRVYERSNVRFGKNLESFDELNAEQVKYVRNFYHFEDILFGYGLDNDTPNTPANTYCNIQTTNGTQCC